MLTTVRQQNAVNTFNSMAGLLCNPTKCWIKIPLCSKPSEEQPSLFLGEVGEPLSIQYFHLTLLPSGHRPPKGHGSFFLFRLLAISQNLFSWHFPARKDYCSEPATSHITQLSQLQSAPSGFDCFLPLPAPAHQQGEDSPAAISAAGSPLSWTCLTLTAAR